jgi:hypothetical protein
MVPPGGGGQSRTLQIEAPAQIALMEDVMHDATGS